MFAPLALSFVCFQVQTTAPVPERATPKVVPDFAAVQPFGELVRLELSPKIDGMIQDEEWDPLLSTQTMQGYLQWAPHAVFAAAKLPIGQDVLLSFDFGAKGWLQGKNHLEVRASMVNGVPKVRGRILDATNAAGPAWVDLPALAVASDIAASSDIDAWTIEMKLVDPGLGIFPSEPGKSVSLRMDAISSTEPDTAPYLPRTLTRVTFGNSRATGLPVGVRFSPEQSGRIVVPGDATAIRLTFQAKPAVPLQKIEMRSEGFAKDTTTSTTTTLPDFDKKGRAFIDYLLRVGKDTPVGYRIARGTVALGDGGSAITQTAYEVAPLIEFDLPVEFALSRPEPQLLRLGVYIKSNSGRRVDGTFTVVPPDGWKIVDGNGKRFILYSSFGRKRQVFAVEAPAGARGAFAFKIRGEVGSEVFEQTVWKFVK